MGWKSRLVEPLMSVAGRFGATGTDPCRKMPNEILVLRPSDLGDLLTTTPIFQALRRGFPTTRIVAAVGSWARPIVENNPFIDEIAELDLPWSNKFVKDQSWPALLRFLAVSPQVAALRQRQGFDAGIDVLGSHVGVLTLLRLGVRHRVGLRGYRGGSSACQQSVNWTDSVHVCHTALLQAEMLGASLLPEARPQIYLSAAEREEASRIWAAGRGDGRFRLLVSCGGGLKEKCWPADALGSALRQLSDVMRGETGAPNIVLVGGKADRERAAQVMAADVPGLRSMCGETSLRCTFALTEQADLVVTNASMLLHVAAAFHRPTVAVLGGMHTDAEEHDRLWGYPPPYASVSAATRGGWPSPEQVVSTIMAAVESNTGLLAYAQP